MRTLGNYLMLICVLNTILVACKGYETNKFENDMISLHNTTRVLHNANILFLDHNLCKEAMKMLKMQYFREVPSAEDPINYNISYSFYVSNNAEKDSATDVFSFWYMKGQGYDYNMEPTSTEYDPFAQIVWKSTTHFGIAVVHKNGENLVVASYFPPGKVEGMYKDNVGRPVAQASSSSS